MSSCIAAEESQANARPAWRAVYALALGVFGYRSRTDPGRYRRGGEIRLCPFPVADAAGFCRRARR